MTETLSACSPKHFLPDVEQLKLLGPIAHIGKIKSIPTYFDDAGDVAKVFVRLAFAIEMKLPKDEIFRRDKPHVSIVVCRQQDSARKLIATLNPDTVTMDLDATRDYLNKLKAVRRGEIGIIGFCWGGGQSFRYATNAPKLKAFVVCYGPAPEPAAMAKIHARGLGVYGENDARINAGLNDAAAAMKAAKQPYPYTVYPGVGHGFLRSREKPEVADSAWGDILRFFRANLKS